MASDVNTSALIQGEEVCTIITGEASAVVKSDKSFSHVHHALRQFKRYVEREYNIVSSRSLERCT